MKRAAPDDLAEFATRLSAMQAEALKLGLVITARALHNGPIRAVGWEIAGDAAKAASYVSPL